jgi:two-component system, LuxR family, sensor kinase FixL
VIFLHPPSLLRPLAFLFARGIAVKLDDVQQVTDQELAALIFLANVGELAGPIAHVFNNFLNTVLLHIAVLEAQSTEKFRFEFAEIRKQARQVGSVVKELQQYRGRQQASFSQTDLNQAVRDSVADLQQEAEAAGPTVLVAVAGSTATEESSGHQEAVQILLQLDAEQAPVAASHPDLTRLCGFLVRNAIAAAWPSGGTVWVRTQSLANSTLLWIEDNGPSLSPELVQRIFEPTGDSRAGVNRLELAACESLVRRLRGRIEAQNRPGGGVRIRVDLPKQRA